MRPPFFDESSYCSIAPSSKVVELTSLTDVSFVNFATDGAVTETFLGPVVVLLIVAVVFVPVL